MTLQVSVITPEKKVFQDDVSEVVAPTTEGQIALLPNHVPLFTQLSQGELILKKGSQERVLAVAGGFLEISKNTVTVLADYAIRSEEIEFEKAQEAKKRAEKLMEEKLSEEDFALIEAQLSRSLLEIKVANRRRNRIQERV